jgi:hypothetical protein
LQGDRRNKERNSKVLIISQIKLFFSDLCHQMAEALAIFAKINSAPEERFHRIQAK